MGRRAQSAARHAEIVSMRAAGHLLKTIAQTLDLDVHALAHYCRTHHVPTMPRPRRVALDREAFRQLVEADLTQAQLAAALDVSIRTIERRMREWDLRSGRNGSKPGAKHHDWSGGRRLAKWGYIEIWAPLHPQAKRGGSSVPEHRLLMEVLLGRYLDRREVVHHRDNHPQHNWPSNLDLFASNADHLRAELTHRVKASPRRLTLDGTNSIRTTPPCPGTPETLAQCPSEIQAALVDHIESHRPTMAHRRQTRRAILRSGAWRALFGSASEASDT